MDAVSLMLLLLTIALSSGRNLLSKSISGFTFGTKNFYSAQAVIFLSGSLSLLLFGQISYSVNAITLLYSVIYGILLLSAQWCYTAALNTENTGVCATVYSLGFIFPTLSGCLFWNEKLSAVNLLGILTVISAVIISGTNNKQNNAHNGNKGIVTLLIAMLSSGGLGVMQKVQQGSQYPEQKSAFILIAFTFAAVVSILFAVFAREKGIKVSTKKMASASGAGICFGCCNLINTSLAGRLDSALFFPTLNIGTILLSVILSIFSFKEKQSSKDYCVLLLGCLSIILLNL